VIYVTVYIVYYCRGMFMRTNKAEDIVCLKDDVDIM